MNTNKHGKEHRSLDILNLESLAAISQQCRPRFHNEGLEIPDINPSSVKLLSSERLSSTPPCELTSHELDECEKEHHQASKTEFPKNVPDNQNVVYDENGCEPHKLRTSDGWTWSTRELSVLDLLGVVGDNGTNGTSEENSVNEAHVAFSVQGLGKVGMETPPQSPHRISRSYSTPVLKVARQLNPSNKSCYIHDEIGNEVDAIMDEISTPLHGSFLELPSYSRGKTVFFSNPEEVPFSFDDCKDLDGHSITFKSSCGRRTQLCDIEEETENIWAGDFYVRHDKFLDVKTYDASRPNKSCQMNGGSDNLWEFQNFEFSEFGLEASNLLNHRHTKKPMYDFDILSDSTCHEYLGTKSYSRCQALENIDELPRHSRKTKGFSFGDLTNQPHWSQIMTEEASEVPSALSEESCSSSAAIGILASSESNAKLKNGMVGSD